MTDQPPQPPQPSPEQIAFDLAIAMASRPTEPNPHALTQQPAFAIGAGLIADIRDGHLLVAADAQRRIAALYARCVFCESQLAQIAHAQMVAQQAAAAHQAHQTAMEALGRTPPPPRPKLEIVE